MGHSVQTFARPKLAEVVLRFVVTSPGRLPTTAPRNYQPLQTFPAHYGDSTNNKTREQKQIVSYDQ